MCENWRCFKTEESKHGFEISVALIGTAIGLLVMTVIGFAIWKIRNKCKGHVQPFNDVSNENSTSEGLKVHFSCLISKTNKTLCH